MCMYVQYMVHVVICACMNMYTQHCDTRMSMWVTRLYSSWHSLRFKPSDNQRHPPDQPAAAELDAAAVP